MAEGHVHGVAVLEAHSWLGGHRQVAETAHRVLEGEIGPAEGDVVGWHAGTMRGGVLEGEVCCGVG